MSQPERKSLYIYDIESSVKDSLELMYFSSLTQESVQPITETQEPKEKIAIHKDNDYFKSDLHRYNLKRLLNNLPELTEEEFEDLLEKQSIESLSGSEGEEEEEDDDQDDNTELRLQALMNNVSIQANTNNNEEGTVSFLNTKTPFIMFKSLKLPQDKVFGAYKSLFNEKELLSDPLQRLKEKSKEKNSKSALLMIGGGHFAAAIISHVPKSTKGNAANMKESLLEQSVQVLASKTFHRYTTRRKQGGSQSASDNSRGKANSAGSSIRRYNEQALIKEVRELLEQWRGHLNECSTIFIRANGPGTRKILVGYEGAPLTANDSRVRNFPFTTRRATASELKRAWVELTYMKILDLPKVNEKAKKKLEKEVLPTIAKQKEVVPESPNDIHTNEITTLIRKQKAPKLLAYLKSNSIDPNTFQLTPANKYANTPTMLHFASNNGLSHMIYILINNVKADPTLENQSGRCAYEVATDEQTKRAFQIARFKLGEEFCDWTKSKVGPATSKEAFDEIDEKEKERLRLEKKSLIQEELDKKIEKVGRKPKFSANGLVVGGSSNNLNDFTGLSDQQKMRLMREQRARAAEARLKKQ